jgi:outer membrane protein assembly factor BamB
MCQIKYNPGVSAPPLVYDGVAYYPTWNGSLVALDYRSCNVLWQTNITEIIVKYKPVDMAQKGPLSLSSRGTPVMGDNVLFIGTLAHALLLAIDMSTGKLMSTLQVNDHPYAVLTQSPTYYQGKIFIGTSSLEEDVADVIPGYKCCSFVGTFNAIEFQDGNLRLIWTQRMIPNGTDVSGVAIWGSQPSIDPIRRQIFIGTGNMYQVSDEFEQCQNQTANITVIKEGKTSGDPCLPRNVFQEAVLALDLDTGRINWARVLGHLDAWNVACVDGIVGPPLPGAAAQCPAFPGPDADFGMAPSFVFGSEKTPDGLDIVVIGQKNSNLYALSAQTGTTLWAASTGPSGLEGGLTWGMAVDDTAVYYTVVNSLRISYTLPLSDGKTVISNSAFGATSLKDGTTIWQTPVPNNSTSYITPAVVNDVVLTGVTGSLDPMSIFLKGPGSFTSLDKRTGQILQDKELDAYFHGAIAAVHDYVMFGTGYSGVEPDQAGTFQVWKVKGN